MKTLKLILSPVALGLTLIIALTATVSSHAQTQAPGEITKETFCSEYIAAKTGAYNGVTGASYKIGHILTIIYAPRYIVKVKQLESALPNATTAESLGEKVIFLMLPHPSISEEDTAKVKEFIALSKKFSRLKSVIALRTVRKLDQEKCVGILNTFDSEFPQIQTTLKFHMENAPLLEKKKDANAYEQFPAYLKKFTKNGWSVARADNYAEMYATLQSNPKISEIMLVLHEGSQYDAEKKTMVSTQMMFDGAMNQLPKKAFFALPSNIQKVILMSCQAEDVIPWYEIDKAAANFDFYYAVPRKLFQSQLIGRFPVIARNAFLPAAKAESTVRTKTARSCSIEIESQVEKTVANIRLNGEFIGALAPGKTTIAVDCAKILPEKNKVIASYLGNVSVPKTSLRISSMRIVLADGKTIPLEVKETFKVSNPDEHYETVGKK